MKKCTFMLVGNANELILSKRFREDHKFSPNSFTRHRRMGFVDVMGLCLNFLRKSLQIEIGQYMELTDPEIERPITKQAFSKARHNISPDAFRELFEMTCSTVFDIDAFDRYKGYRVFAIDSTNLRLPPSKDILGVFKRCKKTNPCPHARASILCEVVSGFTAHAAVGTIEVGERDLAMEHLNYLATFKGSKDLIIFDRGYPSKALLKHLSDNSFKYLMRTQKGFNPEIDNADKRDFSLEMHGCKVRVVKLALPSGETETLVTNLGRQEFKTSEFKELYRLRWAVETKYNSIKSKLDMENFSGKTLVSVLQDFYATLFLSNIATTIKSEANEIIRKENNGKTLKHEYVANENILIGKLKDKLILLMLNDDAEKRSVLLNKLISQMPCYRVSIVKGRQFKRRLDPVRRNRGKPKSAL
jgi:hypothetical protein